MAYAYTYGEPAGEPNYLRLNTMTYPTNNGSEGVLTYGYGDSGANQGTGQYRSYLLGRNDRLTWGGDLITTYGLADDGRAEYRMAMDGADTPGSVQYSYDAYNRAADIDVGAAQHEGNVVEMGRTYVDDQLQYTGFAHKPTRSEWYDHDDLYRLIRFRRGTLNAQQTGLDTTIYDMDWQRTSGDIIPISG